MYGGVVGVWRCCRCGEVCGGVVDVWRCVEVLEVCRSDRGVVWSCVKVCGGVGGV